MKQVQIVIGANYGDEGKGLITDYFAAQAGICGERCVVVCHNGGPQRGHTVETLDGFRHVFHHFGSGTLSGADTYFAGTFLVNPMFYRREKEELSGYFGSRLQCFADPACSLTLPFDMLVNQIAEEFRGDGRHGSCGMGIFETVVRNRSPYRMELGIWKEMSRQERNTFLVEVRDNYCKQRLQELGVKELAGSWKERLESPYLLEHFLEDSEMFLEEIPLVKPELLLEYDRVIFEGGQGLLLDQRNKAGMPHLTPSNTGLKNPAVLLQNLGVSVPTEVCYVTRTYLTRHGAGPLAGECGREEIHAGKDRTNVTNPYQESLRYAPLDQSELFVRIQQDFQSESLEKAELSIAVTHWNGQEELDGASFDRVYYSNGKTRSSVQKRTGAE